MDDIDFKSYADDNTPYTIGNHMEDVAFKLQNQIQVKKPILVVTTDPMPGLITLRVESSIIIIIDSNITVTSSGRPLISFNGALRTPALTGYSSENFPSRTTRSCLLLRKEGIRPNI